MEAYNSKKILVTLCLLICTIFRLTVVASASGQALCGMTKEGLQACKPSVSGRNPQPPNPPCCSALSNADLQCLCRFKDSGFLSFYGINPDKAMALPLKCNVVQSSFHC